MVDLNYWLAIGVGKILVFFMRLFGFGGTAVPGLIALKIDKLFLSKTAKLLKYSIVISGTNGKTTASRLVSDIFKQAKIPYLHNRTGSNLERGIASAILSQMNFLNNQPSVVGLWEVDEAALPSIIKQLQPKIILINNLFRDQMDRYGEIDTLAKKWREAVLKLPSESILILNCDDPTVAGLGKNLSCQINYFGLRDKQLGSEKLSHASDATMCPNCLLPLEYQLCYISHMGQYRCRQCGNIQPKLDFSGQDINMLDNSTNLNIKYQNRLIKITANLTGTYNAYNLLAAVSVAIILKISINEIITGISHFQPAFGRLETVALKDNILKIMLIKNPTGFNQVLHTFKHLVGKQPFACLLGLNDLIADGRDISWIWDVDVENLTAMPNLKKVIISGTRAEDMALRVKYTKYEIRNTKFEIEKDLTRAIEKLLLQSEPNLFILPTYTAMLEVRKILNKKGLVHSTWKD